MSISIFKFSGIASAILAQAGALIGCSGSADDGTANAREQESEDWRDDCGDLGVDPRGLRVRAGCSSVRGKPQCLGLGSLGLQLLDDPLGFLKVHFIWSLPPEC